jgi:hypothetical protein
MHGVDSKLKSLFAVSRVIAIVLVLAPYRSALMEAHDVSPLINKPDYDRADCINPFADGQFRLV